MLYNILITLVLYNQINQIFHTSPNFRHSTECLYSIQVTLIK